MSPLCVGSMRWREHRQWERQQHQQQRWGQWLGVFSVCGEALTARGRMRWGMQRAACGMRLQNSRLPRCTCNGVTVQRHCSLFGRRAVFSVPQGCANS